MDILKKTSGAPRGRAGRAKMNRPIMFFLHAIDDCMGSAAAGTAATCNLCRLIAASAVAAVFGEVIDSAPKAFRAEPRQLA